MITNERIRELAKKSGIPAIMIDEGRRIECFAQAIEAECQQELAAIQAQRDAAIAAEREACAKFIDAEGLPFLAKLLRARSKP